MIGGAAIALLLAVPVAGAGQARDGSADEIRVLREASLHEAAGQLATAERLLLSILDAHPASAAALLALERVLRQQGRLTDLPARAEAGVEREPASALLNQLLLRTYSSLDRVPEIEAAAAAWIEANPGIEIPYRDVARVWEMRGEFQRARVTLEQGRDRVGGHDALALELGWVYATLDQPDLAAREWDRAIGPGADGLGQVRRRLRSLPDGGAGILPELVERVGRSGATPARLAAAIDLAVDAGLEAAAVSLARRLAGSLSGAERSARLLDVARRAEGARMSVLAHWAYGELVANGGVEGLPAIRARYAALALEVGDSVSAGVEHGALEADSAASSAQHRQAAALRVELLAPGDPDAAAESLRAFRDRYRDAAEIDRLSEVVGAALMADGRPDDAESILAGARGPRASLLRGRLALLRGGREEARSAFMAAAPGLRGAEATHALSLATLLGRVSDEAARLLGRALADAATGDPGGALDRLVQGADDLEPNERAALMELAAGMADAAGLDADAVRLRRMIIADHPRSTEAPAALLALARHLATGDGGEARELLERLIIEYPRSALVPQARRELDRIGRRGSGSTRDHQR